MNIHFVDEENLQKIIEDALKKNNILLINLVNKSFNNSFRKIQFHDINRKNFNKLCELLYNYCEDCGKYGLLKDCDSCGDCHVSNYRCCEKYICKNGCEIICNNCKTKYYSRTFDGWHYIIVCSCGKMIRLNNFKWDGESPKFYCDRYCGGGCYDREFIRIESFNKNNNPTNFLKP